MEYLLINYLFLIEYVINKYTHHRFDMVKPNTGQENLKLG